MNKVLEYFIKAKDLSSSVIEKIIGKIQSWSSAAKNAAKATASANRDAANSMSAVNGVMRQTSVNWEQIAKQEELEKRRKRELATLERQLKMAILEAGKANGEAAEQAKQRVEMLKKGIKQMSQETNQDFNLMELGQNTLMGNFEGMAKQIIGLAAKFKVLGMSMANMSVYGVVAMAAFKWIAWCRDKVAELEQKMREIKMDGLKQQLAQLDMALKAVNGNLAEQVKLLDDVVRHQNALADASASAQKAANEQAREKALTGVEDSADRDRINRQYDERNAAIDVQIRKEKFARELEAERDKLAEVERAIADNEILQRERIAKQDAAVGERKTIWEDTLDAEDEDYKAANERVKEAQAKVKAGSEELKKLYEQREALTKGIDERVASEGAAGAQDKADAAKRAREAAEAEKAASEAKAAEAEKNADELDDIWRDWYNSYCEWQKSKDSEVAKVKMDLLADYYDALENAADEKERTAIRAEKARLDRELAFQKQFEDERKAAEDARAERERTNKEKQLAQDLEDTKARLTASTAAQSEAQARVTAAQAAVSQTWGWYKNKDSMAAYRRQMDEDVAAKAQYEKDYKHLLSGHNADRLSQALYLSRRGDGDKLEAKMAEWRKGAFGLSVEDEAAMRVAVAQDEQKRANQALLDISENTASIKSILDLLQGGGEE